MKYAIIGSRNCGAVDITNMVAAAAASFGTPTAIVSGGARGVDKGSVLQELSCKLHKKGRAWSYRRNGI